MDTLADTKIKIDNIISVLTEIKISAVDILKKLDPVMKNIKDHNNDIVLQASKKYPEYSIDVLQNAMQSVTIEWIKDASSVKLEIDKFITFTEEGFVFQTDSKICPFLLETWNGDAYDKQGIEGLKELKNDLVKQFINITRENLFILAAKRIKES